MIRKSTIWDSYEVLKRLGWGGMGEILHVRDRRNSYDFAAKIMRPDHMGYASLKEQFAREIEIHRHLQHPNIVACYHVFQEPLGMLLQYIGGGSLRHLLSEPPGQRQPVWDMHSDDIMDMVRDITSALSYLHTRGYCHCDLKPDNILYEMIPAASGGRLHRKYYLADFGICQRIGEAHDTKRGAPKYTPPEQIAQEPLTAQTDVYSFAITIYEVITGGNVPFYPVQTPIVPREALSPQADTQGLPDRSILDEIEEQHIIKRPPPPSQFRLGIKPAVDAVLLKALEKDPKDRYESIDAFYQALVQALKSDPPSQMQDRGIERAQLVCTTHQDFPIMKIRSMALIGRSRECSIIIPHASISRRHVLLEWEPASACFAVWDQGSKLGTRVNGRLLRDERRYLREGDLITVGDYNFRFEDIRD